MAAFSYNEYSGDDYSSQYRKYLQDQNYVNQIDKAIRETGEMNATIIGIQTREVQNAIHVSSERQVEAISEASEAICATLEYGFSGLNYRLEDINDGISGLSNLVGHGFSLVAEGQKITNKYLGQIQNLLRIPDSQKQRVYHIEEGMKYLQNAFKKYPNSEFYTDALEEFKKSEAIEKKDFFSLFHIGFILLKSDKHFDPETSETYFRNSARYYLAEALISGTNVSNNLIQSYREFLLEAAEAYLFAAEACYLQKKFHEAVELAAEAWQTFPQLTKAGFLQAKYLAANKQVNEAAKILEQVISIDRFFSMEVLPDLDLISKPEIVNLIEKLRVEAVQEAKIKQELCKNVILPTSVATTYLSTINDLIKSETFLEAKEATDLLSTSKEWTISSGANIDSQGRVIAKISSQDFVGSVIDFVKFERDRILALPKANSLILIEEIENKKTEIQNAINTIQSKVNSKNSELRKSWKMWGNGIIVWAVSLAIGYGIGNTTDLIGAILVLASALVIYVGGGILAFLLVVFIINSMSTRTTLESLNLEISSKEKTIRMLNNDIKKLQSND